MTQIPIQTKRYIGLIADVPTGVPTGSTFYDYATGIMHITHDGTNWVEKDTIVRLETSPSIDIGDVTLLAGSAVVGKVGLVSPDGTVITDDTANAVKALLVAAAGGDAVGEVQDTPTAYTLLRRLKDIATAAGLLYTGPPSSVTLGVDDTAGGANIFAAACKLYWMTFTKETANAGFCKIFDGTSGSTATFTIYCPGESTTPFVFSPPIQFSTGLRNAGMSAGAELVCGYIAD